MSEKPLFIRQPNGLTPGNDAAREALKGIAIGSIVACEVSRPRNLKHHRLYWGLVGSIASSIGAKSENVSDVIKLRSGHFTVVQTKKERYQFPRSISFAKMNQAEFSAFFESACRVVCEEFLPHMKPGDLRKEIETMVGLPAESEAA